MDISGKTIVITGGARGLGAVMVTRLAAAEALPEFLACPLS